MSLVLWVIIGSVVVIFGLLALAPLMLESVPEKKSAPPRLRLIEGGKSNFDQDAA
ncbi:MAG TPA: hypothetical protein VEW66_05685 [Thermomicrobiales bacterium]|nr:hypothetical protein [Thermomicrobiales bacterium]